MQTLQNTALAGTKAVKRLRLQKLRAGHPFMINSKIPLGQFYVEYPSGIIQLAAISDSKRDYKILRQLTEQETAALRAQYDLY